MASKEPTYLYQRGRIWWYRQRLPKSSTNAVLRLSLKTDDKRSAIVLVILLSKYLWTKPSPSRGNQMANHSMTILTNWPFLRVHHDDGFLLPEKAQAGTESEIFEMESTIIRSIKVTAQKIIHHYHQLELDRWQSRRRTEGEYIEWLEQLHEFKSLTQEASKLNDLRQSQRLVKDYFEDTATPRPSPAIYDKLVRKVCDLVPSVYDALLKNQPPKNIEELPQALGSTPEQGTEPASEKMLSEVIDAYLSENLQKGWKARTIKQYEHTLFIALHHLGSVPVRDLNRTQGRHLRAILVRLIKGKQKSDIATDGLNACLTDDDALRISVTTANNHMNRLREFFRWCGSMGFIERNPLPDDNLPAPKTAKIAKRDPITNAEAQRIFAHPLFVEHKGIKTKQIQHASHFWLPLIAAYSGMRLGEISQLHVSNIRKIGEINCFVVEASTAHHYLKTANAERAIPIHNELLRLGFLQFVDDIRSKGGERLFNNISLIQGNYSNKPSEWFIKNFRDALGLPKHVTPHAFRHSVKDKLNRVETNPENIARLIGHAGSQYGGLIPEDVSELARIINTINYDEATAAISPVQPNAFHCNPTESEGEAA